jgi:hypothetical protein
VVRFSPSVGEVVGDHRKAGQQAGCGGASERSRLGVAEEVGGEGEQRGVRHLQVEAATVDLGDVPEQIDEERAFASAELTESIGETAVRELGQGVECHDSLYPTMFRPRRMRQATRCSRFPTTAVRLPAGAALGAPRRATRVRMVGKWRHRRASADRTL